MKLNLGGGDSWHEPGWTNLELGLGYDLSKLLLRQFPDNSVERVYTSHCIEHLHPSDVVALLKDVRRVLKPGGSIRIVVPDVDKLAKILSAPDGYAQLELHNPHYYGTPEAKVVSLEKHIEELVGWHWFDKSSTHGAHKCIFSYSILSIMLKLTGFTEIQQLDYCFSHEPDFERPAVMDNGMPVAAWDNPNTVSISIFMEARK